MADDINLNINLDTDQAGKELDKFTQALDQKLKESEGRASAFGKAFSLGLAGIGAAFVAIRESVQFFADGIDAAAESEAAIAKLSNQLKIAGDFSEEAVASFSDFAGAIEKSTNVSEELVLEQAGIAKAFGLSNDETQKLIKAAVELSAVTGDDLSSSVQQLIKSYNGQSKALEASVGEVKTLTKEQLKAGAAIDLIAAKFDGTAAKATQTYAGSLESVNRAIGDFSKEVGKSIVSNDKIVALFGAITRSVDRVVDSLSDTDALNKFIDFAVDGFLLLGQAVTGVASLIERVIGFALLAVTGGIEGLILGLEKLARIAKLDDLANSLEDAKTSLSSFNKSLGKNVADGTGAFGKLFDEVSRVKKEIQATGPVVKKVSEDINKASKGTKPIIDGDELQKAREEFLKFSADITAAVATETEKVNLKRDEQIKKLDELKQKGVVSTKEYTAQLVLINEQAQKEITKIEESEAEKRRAADKKNLEDAKKARDEFKASLGGAFADPIRFSLEKSGALDVNADNASKELTQGIAVGAGILSGALEGKAGAVKFASQAGSALADYFLPGLGQAIGPLISQLAKGPEETKKALKEFAEAFPDILIAIVDALPAIIEVLLKRILTVDFVKRIAFGVTEAVVQAVIDIVKDAGSIFGGEVLKGVTSAGPVLVDSVSKIFQGYATFLLDGYKLIFSGIENLFTNIGNFFKTLFENFTTGIRVILDKIFIGFFDALNKIGPAIANIISKVISDFTDFFENSFNFVIDSITAIFDPIIRVFQKIIDAVQKIASGGGLGDAISSGGKGFFNALGFSSGGIVPSGYPNDSFPARLTSGEMVVPKDMVSQLGDFLSGSGNQGQDLTVTNALLSTLISKIDQPMTVSTKAELNGRTLADIILQLNRNNARLTA